MDAEDDAQVKAREEVERLSNALGGAQRDEKESFGTVFKVGGLQGIGMTRLGTPVGGESLPC